MKEKIDDFTARELFDVIVKNYIESTLGAYKAFVSFVETLMPNSSQAQELANIELWRPFLPPLHNYLISAIEVFLEQYFIKIFAKADGTKYIDTEEWLQDMNNFKSEISWESRNERNSITRSFSFQRLDSVNILYKSTLGFEIKQYDRYSMIKMMFQKRHLFTHRAGIIDRKFLNEYNEHPRNIPENILNEPALGMQAYIELPWLYDALKEAKRFVYWVDAHKSDFL